MKAAASKSGMGHVIAALICMASSPMLAHGETAQDAIPVEAPFSQSPYLLGNWGGERSRLEQKGISFQLGWTNEAAYNVSGGDRRTGRNTGQLAFGSTFDLDKLIGWRSASFQMTMTDRYGRDLGTDAHIGNNQQIQEVWGRGQTWLWTQFWLQQNFFSDRLSIRLGRLPIGGDFGYGDCDFENLTFCGSQAGNIVGSYWMNWPISVWATRVKFKTTPNTYAQLGVYQNNPTYGTSHWERHNGWKLSSPAGSHGVLLPLEFGWTPAFHGLSGIHRFGLWYNSGGGDDLYLNDQREPLATDGGDALHRHSSYGGYVSLKQQVTGTADGRGTTLFLNFVRGDRNTSRTDRQVAVGAQYKGIFNRPNDTLALAFGATHSSGYYADYARLYNSEHSRDKLRVGNGYEKVIETYYGWSPLPAVVVRPNIQYIIDPGGDQHTSNAVAFGVKSSVTF